MKKTFYLALLVAGIGACRQQAPAPTTATSATWALLPYGTPQLTSFGEVRFASAQTGWITGGYVANQTYSATLLSTHDGGATWVRLPMRPLTLNGFITMSPVSEQLVFAVGVSPTVAGLPGADSRAVYKSIDGGATWQELPGAGFGGSFHLHFFDERTGLSFKNQRIQKTTDGGASWQNTYGPSTGGDINLTAFPAPTAGYAAGGNVTTGIAGGMYSTGTLLKTTDQGTTWQALAWPYQAITSLTFLSPSVGFATTYPDHHLYKTTDGGTAWQLVNAQLPAVSKGQFSSEQEGYFAEGQSIYATSDGGQTWQQAYQVSPNSMYSATINSLGFPTDRVGYAVTADGQVLKATK
jgi:photosystem II stability/assembly factor-like uncharacterized protein